MKNAILATDKLCKTFSVGGRQQHVLKNLDLDIHEGDFTVIIGSSGSGKSTLLYALSGMDKPTLGRVDFAGKNISGLSNDALAVFRRDNCGFVFQQTYLLDNMSILDNVMACGLLISKDKKGVAKRLRSFWRLLGLMKTLGANFRYRFLAAKPSGLALHVRLLTAQRLFLRMSLRVHLIPQTA